MLGDLPLLKLCTRCRFVFLPAKPHHETCQACAEGIAPFSPRPADENRHRPGSLARRNR